MDGWILIKMRVCVYSQSMDSSLRAIAMKVKHSYFGWPLDDILIITINIGIFALKGTEKQPKPPTYSYKENTQITRPVTRSLSISRISLRKQPWVPYGHSGFVWSWYTLYAMNPNCLSEDPQWFIQKWAWPGKASTSLAEPSKGTISQDFWFSEDGSEEKNTDWQILLTFLPPLRESPWNEASNRQKLNPRDRAKYTGLTMLLEPLGSALPKATVMPSFNCQLDIIYDHLGRESHRGMTWMRLVCGHACVERGIHFLGRRSWVGWNWREQAEASACMYSFSLLLTGYDRLLCVPATLIFSQWWITTWNCEPNKPFLP